MFEKLKKKHAYICKENIMATFIQENSHQHMWKLRPASGISKEIQVESGDCSQQKSYEVSGRVHFSFGTKRKEVQQKF